MKESTDFTTPFVRSERPISATLSPSLTWKTTVPLPGPA